MASMHSGPDDQNPQQEGPRIRTVIFGFVLAGLVLFAIFFTWYQNTK